MTGFYQMGPAIGPSVGGAPGYGGTGGGADMQQEMIRQQALQQAAAQQAAAGYGQQQQVADVGSVPGAGGGGFTDQLAEAFGNPGIAAALGAGGSILAAADQGGSIGDAIRAGLQGGGAGFFGAAQRQKKERSDERQRKLLLDAITRGYSGIVEDGQMPRLSIYQAMLGLDR